MPRDNFNRKKWSAKVTTLKEETDYANVHDVPTPHEEYLILLQEKNRLLKQLKKKDDKQIALEAREQGFSLYVNGPQTKQHGAQTARQQHTKTAGHTRLEKLSKELNQLEAESVVSKYRSKTAPDRCRRKNWQVGSINLKTHRGEKIRLKAPDILSGEYEDDFEMESVNFAEESGSDESSATDSKSDSEWDREAVKAEMQRHANRASKSRDATRTARDNPEKEMLTLTIDDVKKLRQSLEMNASIQESMAYGSSDSESEGVTVSPVLEEDEEVEEVLSSSSTEDVGLQPIRDKDKVIVLELATKRKERSEKRIPGAPRHADTDARGMLKSPPSESPKHQRGHRGAPPSGSPGNKEIVLKTDGSSRKASRPLSASRKSKNPTQDSTTEAESVLAALKAENENVMSSIDTDWRRDTQSAPGRPENGDDDDIEEFDSNLERTARPATISTGWKDRLKPTALPQGSESRECWPQRNVQNIDHIVQKVLQLDTKGQKRLLKALAHIEDGSAVKGGSLNTKSRKKPLKAIKPLTKMVRDMGPGGSNTIDVLLELHSSWGHPTRVGLTEVQFFDVHKQRIFVNTAHVKVQGATCVKGEVAALFNGKAKTTKERNMWSCAFSNSRRVRISLKLHSVTQDCPIDLGKIKIWNYNKSLNDLKEGACRMRVSVDGHLVFDGELDKGCGNQVFDYGMQVVVRENEPTQQSTTTQPTPSSDSGIGTGSNPESDATGMTSTLTHMENVLFHSEDFSDHSGSHPLVLPLNLSPPNLPVRSETRILNHSTERPISLPVVDSSSNTGLHAVPPPTHSNKQPDPEAEKTRSRSRSHSRDRKIGEEEDSGILRTPRSPAMRRKKMEAQFSQDDDEMAASADNDLEATPRKGSKKKKKLQQSKMAARLDGSGSSVELSMLKDGMERQDSNGDDNSYSSRVQVPLSSSRCKHRRSVSDKDRCVRSEEYLQSSYESNRNNNHRLSRCKSNKDASNSHQLSDFREENEREDWHVHTAEKLPTHAQRHGTSAHNSKAPACHISKSHEETRQSCASRPPSGRLAREGAFIMSPRLHSPRRASVERRGSVERRYCGGGLSHSESMKSIRPCSGAQSERNSNSERLSRPSGGIRRCESMRECSMPSSGKGTNHTERPSSGKSNNHPTGWPTTGKSSNRTSERSNGKYNSSNPSDRPSSARSSSHRNHGKPSSGERPQQTASLQTDLKQKLQTDLKQKSKNFTSKKDKPDKTPRKFESKGQLSVRANNDQPQPTPKLRKDNNNTQNHLASSSRKSSHQKKVASGAAQPVGAKNVTLKIDGPSHKSNPESCAEGQMPVGQPGRLVAEETSFRSASPYMSDEETCMMSEISKINAPGKQSRPHWLAEDSAGPLLHSSKKNFPPWLDKSGQIKEGSDDGIIDDDGMGDDEDLLDNWPKSGLTHLPTVLDDGSGKRVDRPASGKRTDRPASGKHPASGRRADRPSSGRYGEPPTHGRRSRQGQNTPRASTPDSDSDASIYMIDQVADEAEEEVYRRQTSGQMVNDPALPDLDATSALPRMKQIESARAQWRKQEQNRLEESWSSLNVFERSHKGRLSVDMEKDILDEYLNHEPHRHAQPTIEEEPAEQMEEESFTIPELPKGREMVFNIKTTWGDRHYVGLNGIEIFTTAGQQAKITKIWAEPSDINILPEYNKDPRVVSNLTDGVNRTRDDVHVWLAPYMGGQDHKIFLHFDQQHIIAMMRIWNYNKSRIHSYRGAKDVEITLDGVPVFKGEIARACGGVLGGSEAFGDTILFTMDEDILEEVSRHDTAFEADALMDLDWDEEEAERPATADRETEERPFTCAARRGVMPHGSWEDVIQDVEDSPEISDEESFFGQDLRLNFTATWGDQYYLGLTGLEVVGPDGEAIPVSEDIVDADPRDLHVLPGYEQDDRTLDKLINNVNITMNDENMWLIPYTENEDHWLRIQFPDPQRISGLRFWNYNKSPEDTYRGAKIVHVMLDGKQMSPSEGYLIRKGPGNCYFDFAQEISFSQMMKSLSMARLTDQIPTQPRDSVNMDEEYEAAQVPCGFIYQFQLMSSWGDPYYIGLNGLEFYDNEGNMIKLTENHISAYPDSVNVLDGVEGDVRTPDKLINGINATQDGKSMWLAPVLPGLLNKIYVIFDQPMQISMIKLWNYSKTGNRGVKDFALLVDDLLVYNGILKQVVPGARGILPTCDVPQQYHTILFSDDSELRRREKHTIILNQTGEQDVQLTNDHQLVNHYNDPRSGHGSKAPDQALRPMTSMIDRSKLNWR